MTITAEKITKAGPLKKKSREGLLDFGWPELMEQSNLIWQVRPWLQFPVQQFISLSLLVGLRTRMRVAPLQ